jgi:peptidoglycan/LPS O-acetylase OafA/YrhL
LVNGRGNGLTLVWLMGYGIYLYVYQNLKKINFEHGLILSILFLTLSIFYLFVRQEAYDLVSELLLSASILFLVIYTDSIEVINHGIIKKIIIFFSGYSYTLFLIHYSIFELFDSYKMIYSPYILFMAAFIISNLVSSCTAYIFEKNYKQISNILRTKFFVRI